MGGHPLQLNLHVVQSVDLLWEETVSFHSASEELNIMNVLMKLTRREDTGAALRLIVEEIMCLGNGDIVLFPVPDQTALRYLFPHLLRGILKVLL